MLPFEASLSGTLTLHALIELGNIAFIKAHSGAGKVITASVQIVLDWHAALNARDVERLASLSAANVEVGGPRGVGNGIDLLRDWMERAGVRMAPVKWQAQGGSVVVLESAQWQATDGQLTEPQEVASVFRVNDGRVASVIRYADFEAALHAAGMKGQV